MPYLDVRHRVLEAKIVYWGAGLSGKTTNLERLKAGAPPDRVGEMMSLETDGDRTLFFDYLPFELGKLGALDVKLQLFTVPGQARYVETRRRVLAGADGVVLVLDSQPEAADANRRTTAELHEHLTAHGLGDGAIPVLVQLNKRDLPGALPAEALRAACGVEPLPWLEAVACDGQGVFETLRGIAKLVLDGIRREIRTVGPAAFPHGDGAALDGPTLARALGAVPASAAEPSAADPTRSPGPTSASAPAPARAASASPPAPPTPPSAIVRRHRAPDAGPIVRLLSDAAPPPEPADAAAAEALLAGQREVAARLAALEARVAGLARALESLLTPDDRA